MCQDVCIEVNEIVENITIEFHNTVENISVEVRDFSVFNIISQDAGNTVTTGTDGLLFVPESGGGGGSVESVNGNLPDVNGNVVVPIPSKTSDLLNDSGFITESSVPSFADQTETNAGVVTNKTIAPNTLSGWWTYQKGLIQTFAQKITFTLGALFTPQATPTHERGRIYFDDTNDCISFMDSISGTSVQMGYEVLMRARNNTGATILNGSAVYISGAIGQNSTVALARANVLNTSEIIGIATHDIPNNTVGKICVFGLVNDLNTNSFIDGQMLYLSASVAGGLTSSIPASPNFVVALGVVEHAHPTQGKILVRPQRALANNNALGTAQNVPPTENAVKTYVDSKGLISVTHSPFNLITMSTLGTWAAFDYRGFASATIGFGLGTGTNPSITVDLSSSLSIIPPLGKKLKGFYFWSNSGVGFEIGFIKSDVITPSSLTSADTNTNRRFIQKFALGNNQRQPTYFEITNDDADASSGSQYFPCIINTSGSTQSLRFCAIYILG